VVPADRNLAAMRTAGVIDDGAVGDAVDDIDGG
jgi:hypothetical protein